MTFDVRLLICDKQGAQINAATLLGALRIEYSERASALAAAPQPREPLESASYVCTAVEHQLHKYFGTQVVQRNSAAPTSVDCVLRLEAARVEKVSRSRQEVAASVFQF